MISLKNEGTKLIAEILAPPNSFSSYIHIRKLIISTSKVTVQGLSRRYPAM